jgi:hypothetical protein
LAERPLRETVAAFLSVQQQVRDQSLGEPDEPA